MKQHPTTWWKDLRLKDLVKSRHNCQIDPMIKRAIEGCGSEEELKGLLLNQTLPINEPTLRAFDLRFEELENK